MPSTFTWLDYSEHERRKMLDVIELFNERTTRDELGIGGVRDAFADLLFPGTTTIQTVAKYFLLVPWMYLQLEQRHTSSAKVKERARKFEIDLAKELGEVEGVIGRRAKENLQRLPSSVYWQGLLTWGIRLYPGSQDDYHRSLDLFYVRRKSRTASSAEFEGEGVGHAELHNWHDGIPAPNVDFPNGAKLELSWEEASYLRERVMTSCSDSLLAYLLQHQTPVAGIPFAWQLGDELPERLREPLEHAQNFSETIHGAQLLYNLMLAEKSENQELRERYLARLNDWWSILENSQTRLEVWDRSAFWRIVSRVNPRISVKAKTFVNRWLDLVAGATSLADILETDVPRGLVEFREFQIKGTLARTRNQRARELWSGAAGSSQLDLRWGTSRRIVGDILKGLEVPTNA